MAHWVRTSPTHCANCGNKLENGYRRWCDKPECRAAAKREQRRQSRVLNKDQSRKKPRIKQKKRYCIKCGRLIRNGNWQLCSVCHGKYSDKLASPYDVYPALQDVDLEEYLARNWFK